MPGGLCPLPHSGYCLKGVLNVRYADGTQEVIRAGDLYYMPAGHTFSTDADAAEDCELLEVTETADVQAMQQATAATGAR
jgi:mannose-6-phosphate isomerase-like protein (cupin superfamily)